MLGDIAQNFQPESALGSAIQAGLFSAEDTAMAAGTIGADFATIAAVAPPASLWRRLLGYNPISRSSKSSRTRQAGKDNTVAA